MIRSFPSRAFSAWPEIDQAAWILDCTPTDDPFDDPRYGATLRQATLQGLIKAYGIWLAFLVSRGELDGAQAPLDRVTRPRLRGYFRAMLASGKAANTIIGRFNQLTMAMKVLSPGQDVGWIQRPDGATINSMLRKVTRSVIVPDSRVLFAWALELMDTAEQQPEPRLRLTTYRDGLFMAFLASRGRRLRSMHLLGVGRELVWKDDHHRIQLTPDQVKTNKPDRFNLPNELTPYIRHYLEVVRPRLLGTQRHDALWISSRGLPQTAKGIQGQIGRRSKARFGTAFGPHRFRHAIATTLALQAPEDPGLAAALLGISPEILEQHYNRAGQVLAAKRYAALFRKLGR